MDSENYFRITRFEAGEINYIFCDDAYLLKLNVEFLQHDTLTDIISFDNSLGKACWRRYFYFYRKSSRIMLKILRFLF